MSLKTTPQKGGTPHEPFTVKLARHVVGDVIARIERGQVVPRTKKKSAEEEIDDLVDDLDELDEDDEEAEDEVEEDEDDDLEDEDEEEEDEEEEDPDEAPKRTRSRKSRTAKKSAPKKEKVGIGTKEVADASGIEPRQLRMFLREKGVQPRDDRDGRYSWPSLKDKEVVRIIKEIRGGAVDKMNKEKLANLKKKGAAKKTTAKKRSRASK